MLMRTAFWIIVAAILLYVFATSSNGEVAARLLRDDFYIDMDQQLIYLTSAKTGKQAMIIPKKTLFDWLDKKDMLSWTEDFYDPRQRDGHGQRVGSYTIDDYFLLDDIEIKEDIRRYLKDLYKLVE